MITSTLENAWYRVSKHREQTGNTQCRMLRFHLNASMQLRLVLARHTLATCLDDRLLLVLIDLQTSTICSRLSASLGYCRLRYVENPGLPLFYWDNRV